VHRGRPRHAALLDRLERPATQSTELPFPESGCDRSRSIGLDREDLGHAELGGFLHQPGKAIPVAGGDSEAERSRARRLLCPFHDDLDGTTLVPNHAAADEALTVPEADREDFADPAHS